jgi:putative flavoprotein involved in K+ transport
MSIEQVEVAIIGGGQAGLAISYYLTQHGREHVVLEQGRLAESWRSKRWDSLCVVGPNWTLRFPGFAYQGNDPDGFMSRDEVVRFLEQYGASFHAPLRCGVRVTAVEQSPRGTGYRLQAGDTIFEAAQVVIATGAYQQPKVPTCSADLPVCILQLVPNQYRRPQDLPPGAVLVVGSGESGCQIAEELRRSGRAVYLSVGRCWWAPRRYRGKDCVWWAEALGIFDQTVDMIPGGHAKFAPPSPQQTGSDGGRDLNLHTLAGEGVVLLGRVQAVRDETLILAPDLQENIAKADEEAVGFAKAVDDYIQTAGLDCPEESLPSYPPLGNGAETAPILELDLQATQITSIIWATGYRPDLRWVRVPALDDEGYPVHTRGVTAYPGLYFLGLELLYNLKSGLFHGVGEDAAYLASRIEAHASEKG